MPKDKKMTLVLATRNEGKVREIKALLADLPLEIRCLKDYPEAPQVLETGKTFFENAFQKAREIAQALGELTLADDSGLEVDALGGRPGVYSARFAGPKATDEENYLKLLEELKDVPPERRTARFRCVIVVYHPSGHWLKTEGTWEGLIATAPRGKHGFGYDPVFLIPELGQTAAEIPPEVKNQMSHRAKALAQLKEKLPAFLEAL